MKKKIIFSLAFLTIIFFGINLIENIPYQSAQSGPQVMVSGQIFHLELARTALEQRQGLSGRSLLCPNCGMLFIFPSQESRSFWMKDMNFPLDIIWLDGEKIVGLNYNLPPGGETPTETYTGPPTSDRVLEINAGTAERLKLRVGDTVKLKI